VGKTTAARVLAMALNCPNRADDGEPCGTCESCQRIWSGNTSLDVVEIDAASNRGVDDARDLRERAMYAPSGEDRYKVYIVDEAHMLTREAWNALLKILEEPPPRVIFVFATTEPQKIQQAAAPILSRCQRFDFRRIGVRDVVERVETVLKAEGAAYEAEALHALARKADGGMRDALSLTDQVLSLTGTGVTLDAVRQVLGLVADERYLELFGILGEARHREIFNFVEGLVAEGYDLVEFYHGFVETVRTLLRLRLGEDVTDLGVPAHLGEAMAAAAEAFEAADLVRMLSLAAELETTGNLRRIPDPQALIELLLLRLSYLERTASVEDLLAGMGTPAAPAPPSPSGARTGRAGTGSKEPVSRPELPPSPAPKVDASKGPAGATTSVKATSSSPPQPAGTDGRARPAAGQALSLAEAWRAVTEAGDGLPSGLSSFLRSAEVREDAAGTVHISLPPGPGLDRMEKPAIRAAVSAALGALMGRTPPLEVESKDPGSTGATRVTQQTVRDTRLKELLDAEPALEPALDELDLELTDE